MIMESRRTESLPLPVVAVHGAKTRLVDHMRIIQHSSLTYFIGSLPPSDTSTENALQAHRYPSEED
jgi:hypothetical protein